VTERLRDCAPVPHDLVQVDQTPNADVAQWMGHGPLLHACVSAVWPQALPPNVGSATMTRLRDCEPAPHVVLHAPKSPKLGTSQSVGQSWALHVRTSSEAVQALPPKVGGVSVRLRLCDPLAHDLVHVDQAPNAGSTQSVAHAWLLQSRVSAECGHAAPPFWGGARVRVRDCAPVPHDLVHVDHESVKETTPQSIGQGYKLHSRVSS
jgi:hypothetical protein